MQGKRIGKNRLRRGCKVVWYCIGDSKEKGKKVIGKGRNTHNLIRRDNEET